VFIKTPLKKENKKLRCTALLAYCCSIFTMLMSLSLAGVQFNGGVQERGCELLLVLFNVFLKQY
jgi:hypothetical protein